MILSRRYPFVVVRRFSAVVACVVAASMLAGCAGESEEPEQAEPEEQVEAFTSFPSQFPSDSDWALAMITRGCGLSRSTLAGAKGTIARAPSGQDGVVYEATRGAKVVASAWARSTFIGAEKRCLTK